MKKCFIFTLALVLLSSCQQVEDDQSLLSAIRRTDNQTAFQETITAKAVSFYAQVNGIQPTRISSDDIIESVYPWKKSYFFTATRSTDDMNNMPDTLMYVVNFKDDQGFVLLSADERIDEVFAYAEHGTLSPADQIDNPGFQLYMEGLKGYLTDAYSGEKGNLSVPTDTLPVPTDTLENTPQPQGKWLIETIIYPILSTKWHQNAPFNRYCYTKTGEQALAGCVAIAVAQIVAKHQSPTTYNGHTYLWNYILDGPEPQTETGRNSVAYLISDIGQLVETNYGINASDAHDLRVRKCLDSLGYTYSPFSAFTFDSCFTNFSQGKPVYIAGYSQARHAWVLDGAIIRKRPTGAFHYVNGTYEPVYKTENLVHCNWGWGDNLNGYFQSNVLYFLRKHYTDEGEFVFPSNEDDPLYYFDSNIYVYKDISPIN